MYVCLTMRADHTFQGTVAGFQKTCIETHTGFKGFLRMCVWLCLQTMHYKDSCPVLKKVYHKTPNKARKLHYS